jgi:hypothetical protein
MRVLLAMGTMILEFGLAGQQARATDSPQDPCSLLTAAQVSSTLGDKYAAQEKSVAPRPFPNTVLGTDCHYKTASGGNVRYFLTISHGDTPRGRKQILALAALVAGEL